MLVGDVAEVGVAEERKGVVLAERVKGNRSVDDLAELTVGTPIALGRKGCDQLVVTLITLGRIEHRTQVTHRRL